MGDISGGMKCIKYTLFTFNLLFWLMGAAMLGLGIFLLVDTNTGSVLSVTGVPTGELYAGGIVLTVAGSITMVVGFFGCCGAIKESQCMLVTFAVFLCCLIAMEIAVGVYYVVAKDRVNELIENSLNSLANKNYTEYSTAEQALIDTLQKEMECCGMNSTDDWDPKPSSCVCDISLTNCVTPGNWNRIMGTILACSLCNAVKKSSNQIA
ncbi:PREDICTED: leukocyte surface antigen CD53-like isoform X2 [Branchiostoma belcheri]|uniref:Tetraspanin n=1 Tax=Branchiostoma belcheri TaxID=7741 RepID=A0A6P4YN75_BRABE|nr:PREDICTED: leukocyte surface antigen CD53-like isoform X2 [Branchiostoma belcheri]